MSGAGREPWERTLPRLAATQLGVFTLGQAQALGVSRSIIAGRTAKGTWERLYPGVYRLSGAPMSWHASLLAACFAWGDGAVISHRAAAALWDMAGFPRGEPELTVRRKRERTLDHVVHRPVSMPSHDVTIRHRVPVTVPARTLLDLAGLFPIAAVEEALDDALRRNLVTLPRLKRTIDRAASPGRPGIGPLRALIRARDAGVPESVFETRLLRALIRGGLPMPTPQYEIHAGGRLVARVDLAYPSRLLAIEADGFRWHSIRADFERDARRHSALASLGWRVVRVTWARLDERPEEIVSEIRIALSTAAKG